MKEQLNRAATAAITITALVIVAKRAQRARRYLIPGVYVEEVPAGSKPIEGVGTAIAAFVGLADPWPFFPALTRSRFGQRSDRITL